MNTFDFVDELKIFLEKILFLKFLVFFRHVIRLSNIIFPASIAYAFKKNVTIVLYKLLALL